MPGQRKRKQQRERRQRAGAGFTPEAGRWEVLFETQDGRELHAEVRRLRADDRQLDWTSVRVDTFCGRLSQPTTYRLSLFVPHAAPAVDESPDGQIARRAETS
ncbi:hypothetical protein AB0M39_32285 [Streptomyces sp. NPDC051907]|uniref:hypothetical protein n=1 Tax=Streptomyces sp. NPDC051907 TaxID=3155284 RepID=UPI00343E5EDB